MQPDYLMDANIPSVLVSATTSIQSHLDETILSGLLKCLSFESVITQR